MTDPYSVLGIQRNASDDDVKEAYRRLAEKYNSLDYSNDPMASLAGRRMRELDDAYDSVMAERRGGTNADTTASSSTWTNSSSETAGTNYGYGNAGESNPGGAASGSYGYGNQRGGAAESSANYYSSPFAEIRAMLGNGDYLSAEQRLLTIEGNSRGAEWSFLMGSVCQQKGWLDEAYRYYTKAASLEPSNQEYAAACNNVASQRQNGTRYSTYGRQAQPSANGCSDDCCRFLQCYCCGSMCCDSCCS